MGDRTGSWDTIINVASVDGLSPETLNGVYGASKAYVIALNHSLQHGLAANGIRIQTMLPGATATELWDKLGSSLQVSVPIIRPRAQAAFRQV